MFKTYETRSEFVEATLPYIEPISSIERDARLERGWRTNCRMRGVPVPEGRPGSPFEEETAKGFRARAVAAASEFRAVVPTTKYTAEELAVGWLAARGRDASGRLLPEEETPLFT